MNELKAITVLNAYQLECNDNDLVYLKSDVDKVIAEKDTAIRRLKRALYKACANWANCEKRINGRDAYVASGLPRAEDKFCKKTKLWGKMKDKCLKKVDEHKFREE